MHGIKYLENGDGNIRHMITSLFVGHGLLGKGVQGSGIRGFAIPVDKGGIHIPSPKQELGASTQQN